MNATTRGPLLTMALLLSAAYASAQMHAPLIYHGGFVLESFRMFPLYYGNWSSTDLNAQQNYITGLAGYLSGQNSPSNQQQMMKQYGIAAATVAPPATASPGATPAKLNQSDVVNIIHANQANGNLPPYSSG